MTTVIGGSYPSVNSDSDATINGLTVGKGGGASDQNTAVGFSALSANTTGTGNSAFARNSLALTTTGGLNTAVGVASLYTNTTGSNNTAIGYTALFSNTTASNNTAVGFQAGYSNTTGRVTAIGYLSLYTNTTGDLNTAVGYQASYFNTTGSNNSSLGIQALYSNTTGGNNTAMGFQSLNANTTASNNTAVGYQAGYTNTVATHNTFIGWQAGYSYSGTGGAYNTFVGAQAGQNQTSGQYNTYVGLQAGYLMTTGTRSTIIGGYSGNQGGLDIRTASNYIVLSDGDGNPQAYFQPSGNLVVTRTTFSSINAIGCYQDTSASAANVFITTSGSFVRSTSSRKYKTDIQDATHGLADVLNLRSVTYKGTGNHDSEQVLGGLIAEEVHDAGLTEFVQYADDGTPDALAYGHMVSLCVKAIQELNAKLEAQALEIAQLKGK